MRIFLLYAVPEVLGLILVLLGGAHRYRRDAQGNRRPTLWREGLKLLGNLPFLASCLAICQSFFFLVGVTRVAFPFLAVNHARHRSGNRRHNGADFAPDRYLRSLLSAAALRRFEPYRVILLGVALGIPMFLTASLRHRLCHAADSTGDHDHGLRLHQRRRDDIRSAISAEYGAKE